CHLEFDRAAGWTRPRAEEWLRSHLKVRDLNRTATLETPHRLTPGLAAVLSDGFLATPYRLPGRLAHPAGAALEFVMVPPLQRKREAGLADRRRKDSPRGAAVPSSPPRAGAGLELDLSAARP